MHIIEAPDNIPPKADLFLAGGISNCPNWQEQAIELLGNTEGTAINPRRSEKFTEDIADEQIAWEHQALRVCDSVIFWFPSETLCPITLFELGVFTQRKDTPIFVGTDLKYGRRFDVIKQLQLERPEIIVRDNVKDVIGDFIDWNKAIKS